jgi:hypothetical protein
MNPSGTYLVSFPFLRRTNHSLPIYPAVSCIPCHLIIHVTFTPDSDGGLPWVINEQPSNVPHFSHPHLSRIHRTFHHERVLSHRSRYVSSSCGFRFFFVPSCHPAAGVWDASEVASLQLTEHPPPEGRGGGGDHTDK